MRSVRYILIAAFLFIAGMPTVWMVYTGLKSQAQVDAGAWSLPAPPVLDNYRNVLSSGSFGRCYLNSLIVCAVAGVGAATVASLAAYALARLRFRGRGAWYALLLVGMMIPVHITLVPLFLLLRSMDALSEAVAPATSGWWGLDSYFALIGPYVGFAIPVSVFILRGFFRNVPGEIEDAARLDGCSTFGVFWRVVLPIAKPAIATVVIFNFVAMWNEFIFALAFINNDPSKSTLPLGIWQFSGEYGTNAAMMCAALSVSVLPALVVYFIAQKHIIRGLTAGALSG